MVANDSLKLVSMESFNDVEIYQNTLTLKRKLDSQIKRMGGLVGGWVDEFMYEK